MSEIEKIRVVPSGKVYRQMFEAQSLLHQQLIQPKSQSSSADKKGLPIMRTSREASAQGLLNSRQKSWLNGLPFDIYTENPVLYKQYAKYIQAKKVRCQSPAEKSLVQALPETVVAKPHSSNIVERIESSRCMRHDAALEDLSHELNIVASKLEQFIEDAAQRLFCQLEEDDAEIEAKLSTITTDEDLLQFNYTRLENVWFQVQEHLSIRQNYIKQLDQKFIEIENLRSAQVQQLFVKYYTIFEKIAYKSKTEIQRMMDNIVQMINQALLSNKMNYTNMYVLLMTADTEREKKQRTYWESRFRFWKDVNIRRFLDQYSEHMNSGEVMKPPIIEELMEKLVVEHTGLNNQYKQLLNALRDLHPPKCIPSLLEQWYEQTQVVSRGMYESAGMYVLELERTYEASIKNSMDKLEETKMMLLMNQLTSPEIASTLTEEFTPMIKCLEMRFMEYMAELKMNIDKEFTHSNQLIMDTFIFLQSVAKLWQMHETGLGKQEQMLHESLQEHRSWHNEQNQKKENKLDSILDEMRQGSDETTLNSLLTQTKSLLTSIHISYQEFYADQVKIVKTYPSMVAKQLEYYQENICTFFKLKKVDTSVDQIPRIEEVFDDDVHRNDSDLTTINGKADKMNIEKSSSPHDDAPIPVEQNESSSQLSRRSEKDDDNKMTPEKVSPTDNDHEGDREKEDSNTPTSPKSVPVVDPEPDHQPCYLVTDAGTKYLCLEIKENKENEANPEDAENDTMPHLHIADEFVEEIKQQIRMNFLNHLDTWLDEAKKNSNHATVAKIEELDAELSLRTQLHVPREKRIEQDVYNVRAGELLLHSSRVAEHCRGVEKALDELKTKFLSIKQQQEKMMGEFHNEIELMEPAFLNITKSGRLVTLRNQMSKEIQKLMVNIRTNLRVFRVQLDQALQTVRESNASLVQNFKLFSDGGNFCPTEVSNFQRTIEELSKMIDDNECQILVEMEGMEANRSDQASHITIEFEDRFKNHIFDLLFMEAVARWLTNTQVQIKTQVAKNNTSSKDLSNFITTLRQNIEECEQPNPDLIKVESSEIAQMFMDSLEMINFRAKYMKCLKTYDDVIPTVHTQTPFTSEIPSVSKPGKVMLEDSSVGMIKSILRSQKIPENIEEAEDSSIDEDASPASNQENGNESSPTEKKKNKAKYSLQKSMSRIYKRHIVLNHSTKAVKLKLNFGEDDKDSEEQEEEPSDFLGHIKQLVQNTFVDVGAIAEDYYRQKGARPITRPQVLQDTFENCAETLGDKLVSYYTQAKEYIQRCHTEFHNQLEELETLSKRIPPLLFRSLLDQHMNNLEEEFSKWENTFQENLKHFEQEQQRNSHFLQPNLGHPQKADQLQKLNEDEINRHKEFNSTIEKSFQQLQKCSIKCSESFLQELVKLSEKLLLQLDDLLINLDILGGKIECYKGKQHSTETEKSKPIIERKRGTWPGISLVELYTKTSLKSPFGKKMSASINTAKNNLPQQSTFQSRNDAFQIYVSSFEKRIASMEKRKKNILHEEQRWFENWKTSVENIQQLFV